MKIPMKYDGLIYDGYEENLTRGVPITQIADILNEEWGTDFSESSMRGRYTARKQYLETAMNDQEYQEQLFKIATNRSKLVEERKIINKQRTIVDTALRQSGERRVLENIIREFYQKDYIHRPISQMAITTLEENVRMYSYADAHWGYVIEMMNNTYNPEVAQARLTYIFKWIIEDAKRHGYKEIIISDLGDQIEGASLRVSQLANIAESMTKQAKHYAVLIAGLIKMVAQELPEVKITMAMVSEDNHSQIRLYNTKRDELGEGLAELICADIENIVNTAHEYGGLKNLTFVTADEILLTINGFNMVLAHGHQYGRNDDILKDVELRHQVPVHLYVAGHWHRFSIKWKDVKDGAQQAMIFLPSVVGDTDFSDTLHVSTYPGFCKITINTAYKISNAKVIRLI